VKRGLVATLAISSVLAACTPPAHEPLTPLPPVASGMGVAAPRVNGGVGTPEAVPLPQVSYGTATATRSPVTPARPGTGTGTISLNFADTDIQAVVDQILGKLLRVNYAIDPAVHGTVTLQTARPIARSQLLSTLQVLLSQDGATLLQSGALYRVVPAAAATAPGLAGGTESAGSVVLPLHYAAADSLAKILQPYVGHSGSVIAGPGSNALVISGEPVAREALVALAQAFDVDALAGQSYALLPVSSGGAKEFASALQDAFRSQRGEALASVVRAVPMERINSVLLIASQRRYIDDARRIYEMVARRWRQSVRSWHVYYLQNSRADDVAYLLQQAFTPDNITARPTRETGQQNAELSSQFGGMAAGGAAAPSTGITGGTPNTTPGGIGLAMTGTQAVQSTGPAAAPQDIADASPLLGGLSATTGSNSPDAIRIIADTQNNAVLVYSTPHEEDSILAMLHKIDILPLQVRIDATIAEVTLNSALQYGTQWFFKSGGVNGVLSAASGSLGPATLAAAQLSTNFPGFVVGGNDQGGAPFVINALQQVTTVHVLSSPEIMVLDNQPASLMVGSLVPYLTATTTSTLTANAAITNSINYQPTGVIMRVTPRVNSGGLVTIDVQQEVSSVASTTTTVPGGSGINSPTFNQREVVSRVVVQDGQTVGLAGLITDSISRGNQGIPWLKDVPILGLLAGQQNNQRSRTELLVLITPHVMHNQQDARALTQDLRDELANAAALPQEVKQLPPMGSADPGEALRRKLNLN
jgi:general secretion pathway protein D